MGEGDRDNIERARFEQLRAELTAAFRAPEASYTRLSAADVIARNAADRTGE